jgi:hypothetical protein
MPVIGLRSQDFLPSVWAEARVPLSGARNQGNLPQAIVTRAEAATLSNHTSGPPRDTTREVLQPTFRDVVRPRLNNERYPDINQRRYSAVARNHGLYHPYDYLSYNHNIAGRGSYSTLPNPVIINKVA